MISRGRGGSASVLRAKRTASPARPRIVDRHVGIGDGGQPQIGLDRMWPFLGVALELDLDPGAVRTVPGQAPLLVDVRAVPGRVDRHEELGGELVARDATDDVQGLADGELPVHAGGRDPHALLAAGLAELVEFRAVEQLAEDPRDLALDDSGPVVLDDDARSPVAVAHLDPDLGQDACLLAGVEGIVHGLLDGREQRLGGRVEAEQVAVLEKELGDRDLALPARHLDGGGGRGLLLGHDGSGASGGMLRIPSLPMHAMDRWPKRYLAAGIAD
ncbi:MAG: hypothetical protein M5U07_21935 [Xanthobacteraceae bacterium]|nr:hypothetical protein [Xanthobacteraceae bacterium]